MDCWTGCKSYLYIKWKLVKSLYLDQGEILICFWRGYRHFLISPVPTIIEGCFTKRNSGGLRSFTGISNAEHWKALLLACWGAELLGHRELSTCSPVLCQGRAKACLNCVLHLGSCPSFCPHSPALVTIVQFWHGMATASLVLAIICLENLWGLCERDRASGQSKCLVTLPVSQTDKWLWQIKQSLIVKYKILKFHRGNSPEVKWLGIHALTAEGPGSIPGWRTKIP